MRYTVTFTREGVAVERWRSSSLMGANQDARALLSSQGRGEVFVRDEERPDWLRRYYVDDAGNVRFEEG